MAVKRWVWVVVGLVTLVVLSMVAFVGASVYIVASHVNVQPSNRAAAEREFEQVRARFAGRLPLIDVVGDSDVRARLPPVARDKPPATLETLRVVVWNPEEDQLVRVNVPFWVVRLAGWKPMNIRSDEFDFDNIHITPEDLERYGPGLILDHRDRRGTRVLVWAE